MREIYSEKNIEMHPDVGMIDMHPDMKMHPDMRMHTDIEMYYNPRSTHTPAMIHQSCNEPDKYEIESR